MGNKDKYIEENRGYITASKMKEFIKSPEQFFLKYIKETDPLEEKEKRHFIIGTAIDDLISYGENEFNKKYFIDEGLLKAELEDRLFNMGVDTKGLKVDDMKVLLYGDFESRIRLTKGEGESIQGMVKEFERQKLFNKNGGYDCQKTFIGQYKSLKLKGTIDRYKPGEIRDTKTCASIDSFMWDWKEKLGYDVSMSFYWVLVHKATGDKPALMLDVVQKTFPYPSRTYGIPKEEVLGIVERTIIPALDTLDAMMIAWEKTKDESIWKVRRSFKDLCNCDLYPIMETAIQEEIEILQ